MRDGYFAEDEIYICVAMMKDPKKVTLSEKFEIPVFSAFQAFQILKTQKPSPNSSFPEKTKAYKDGPKTDIIEKSHSKVLHLRVKIDQ